MSISFDARNQIFWLNTPRSTYAIGVMEGEKLLGHLYYGAKIPPDDVRFLSRVGDTLSSPADRPGDRLKFHDAFPMEYPTQGVGDFRVPCLSVRTAAGHTACSLAYRSHRMIPGKPELPGLPAVFGTESDCTTLEILCEDAVLNLQVTLRYTVFEHLDAIARSVSVENRGQAPLWLTRVLSACLDMDNESYELLTLNGAWARERAIFRRPLFPGRQSADSQRGVSSHQANPFMAVMGSGAGQDSGAVYAMNLVYSGNFTACAELTQFDTVRAVMGISPENFCWKLEPGQTFTAPEVILVWSGTGLDAMTHTYHDLYRRHLIRGKYKSGRRPVLINNWEATYFDFDAEKILSIAQKAAEQGIDMLVLDDGWFGARNSDACGLGDWWVNDSKLPGGMRSLVEQINGMGLKFGLWFEPEMVSPDSELYRAHPDWAIQIPGRAPVQGRSQLVLDITRPEVRRAVYEQMKAVLQSANIEYVKWDMNRNLSDLGSYALPADQQGELAHRYVLALYEMQAWLTADFPDLLLENCSSGGGRFDPGMLYYSPQIWCSDDTDAVERLTIQKGTALVYPVSAMGTHISVCPCHSSGRMVPFDTRCYAALPGTFGYELDITKLSKEERQAIPAQIELFRRWESLIREGDYYRLTSYRENHCHDAVLIVSKDKSRALAIFIQVAAQPMGSRGWKLRLRGLDPDKAYRINNSETVLHGSTLMNAGLLVGKLWGDYQGRIFELNSEEMPL